MVLLVHVIKACRGSRVKLHSFIKLSSSWRRLVCLTAQLPYPEKKTRFSSQRRLFGPCTVLEKLKFLALAGIRTQTIYTIASRYTYRDN
jgi:hypothetical protein